MMIRSAGFVGVGALGLAAVGMAAPAAAVVVPGCGDVPVGTTATVTAGVCQLDFTTAGSYNWTLPTGITGLHALLVGAGGGTYFTDTSNGYAGSGGEVLYIDYSSEAEGSAVAVNVGAGGQSSDDPDAGDDTIVDFGAPDIALGGIAGGFFTPGYCTYSGAGPNYVGTGNGAGGASGGSGDDCDTDFGPGVNPSLGDADSASVAVPSQLASINVTFGTGGRIVTSLANLAGTGRGADALYSVPATPGDPTILDATATGGSGRVIFVYSLAGFVPAGTGSTLAASGVPVAAQLGAAAGLAALGALVLAFSRRRRTPHV